jgi:competence ComEA-like helix-hairpin-helix protein
MRVYSPKQSWFLLSLASLLFVASLFLTRAPRQSLHGNSQTYPLGIAVEIVGDIPNPGIYSFTGQVTVEQAFHKAGGIGKVIVKRDEKHIFTLELARMEPEKCIVFSIPLNLNEVEPEDLTLIPGIGLELAQRIIQYRFEKEGFRKIEELMEVRGIGRQKLRNLKRYLIIPKG